MIMIKGMEMPRNCGVCKFTYFKEHEYSWYSCSLLQSDTDEGSDGSYRQPECPLVDISENKQEKGMIYNYLKEKLGEDIVGNPFEFEDWFNRMVWHVKECNRLAKLADKPMGRWIEYDTGWVACNKCHTSFPKTDRFDLVNFCPYCGTEMQSGDAE